jgi:hypothetical protein
VRSILALALLLGSLPSTASGSSGPDEIDEDDPKCARGECRPPPRRTLDEDDPKLARGFRRARPVARFDLSYRFLQIADPFGGSLPFHLIEATGYPLSGIFRLGVSLAGGGAPRDSAWMFDVGLAAGLQYPYRVTPFLDLRFHAGVVGANIVDRNVVTYEFRPVLEGGAEFFIAGGFHLTAAIGWAHTVYGGVDANAIQQQVQAGLKPKFDVINLSLDTVTARVGLGF